jgi:hypothetical protein
MGEVIGGVCGVGPCRGCQPLITNHVSRPVPICVNLRSSAVALSFFESIRGCYSRSAIY